jgi:DNA processing protein
LKVGVCPVAVYIDCDGWRGLWPIDAVKVKALRKLILPRLWRYEPKLGVDMALEGDERSAATALASLPLMTPARLRVLLHHERPSTVVHWLATGKWREKASPVIRALLESRRDAARSSLRVPTASSADGLALGRLWQDHLCSQGGIGEEGLGIEVHQLGQKGYPAELAVDPSAPALIFARGAMSSLCSRRVGIIGSRHATAYGRSFAHMLGRSLAANGVSVISGLARGIDGSAHRGALEIFQATTSKNSSEPLPQISDIHQTGGRPVGVVASGLDVIYPPEHRDLWSEVANHGLLLSESPPGTVPAPFRFPLRNRIIAALSEVLVVVESKVDGGSMITVRHALRRGITVMAVPGTTSTRASEGTNLLLRDGALVALTPDDVLCALDLDTRRQVPYADIRPQPLGIDAEVLKLFDHEPLTLDDVVTRRGDPSIVSLGEVAMSLGRLETLGWVQCTAGWFERVHVSIFK